MADERAADVLLAIHDALLGAVSAHLRAITAKWEQSSIHFDAYFDGDVTDEDRETMAIVDTEVLAGFPDTHTVTHAVHRIDFPAQIPKSGKFVFLRWEDWPPLQ